MSLEYRQTTVQEVTARTCDRCGRRMTSDGQVTTDVIAKATRDAVFAFMAAQGEADYINRREMQRRVIEAAKTEGKYKGRTKAADVAEVVAWRAEHGASIAATAAAFGISPATVKRYSATTV
jgi:putative DNA-invertase from lambdoid prophage Rac